MQLLRQIPTCITYVDVYNHLLNKIKKLKIQRVFK